MFFPYGHSTEPQTSNLSQSPSFAGRTLHESCSREQRREASGRRSKPADSIGRHGLNLTQTQRGGGAERGTRVDWWPGRADSRGTRSHQSRASGQPGGSRSTASAKDDRFHASHWHIRTCRAGQARRASRTRHWPCPSPNEPNWPRCTCTWLTSGTDQRAPVVPTDRSLGIVCVNQAI